MLDMMGVGGGEGGRGVVNNEFLIVNTLLWFPVPIHAIYSSYHILIYCDHF